MNNKGFTLIEILIVVLIVGLLALSVMLRGGSQDKESAKVLTARLQSMFIYTEQQAILQPATLGFDADAKKYHFLIYIANASKEKDSWQPYLSDTLLQDGPLPDKITLTFLSANQHPAIIFFPNGEITPFKMNILEDKKTVYQITGEANGAINARKTFS